MARIKLDLPSHFPFSTRFPVRITDLNYGGHAGNDAILSMIHEARVRFLQHHGYSELNLEGLGLIMSDVAIQFRAELFYGDEIIASVAATEFTSTGFELYYRLEKEKEGKMVLAVAAKTGMICFDYSQKKIASLPQAVMQKLNLVTG